MTTLAQTILSTCRRWHMGRWLAGLVVVVLLFAGLSCAFLPGYVKRVAAEQVQQQIGRKLEITDLHFSPFTLTLTADGIALYEPDQHTPAVKVKQLVLNLSLASVFRQALIIDEIRLSEPSIHIVRRHADKEDQYNFSDIQKKIDAMPKGKSPFHFSLANLQLSNGTILIDDEVVNKKISVDALQLGVPFLSNFPNQVSSFVEPKLSAHINGADFSLKGRARPFASSKDMTLAIDLEQLDLASYVPYIPVSLPVQIQRARLSTRLDLTFSSKEKVPELLLAGDIRLQDLDVQDKHSSPLLKMAEMTVHVAQFNVLNTSATVDKVVFSAPEVWLDVDAQGRLNWARLNASSKPATADTALTKKENKPLPLIRIGEVRVQKGQVHLSDAAHATPALSLRAQDMDVSIRQLSTAADAPASPVTVGLHGEQSEQLEFNGTVQALSGIVDGQAKLTALPLAAYQGLFNKHILAKISGQLDLSSHIHADKNQFQLDDLALKLDAFSIKGKSASDGGITLKSLALTKLKLDTATRRIQAGSLLMDGLATDLRRDPQAVLNLQKWLLPAPVNAVADTQPATGKASAGWQFGLAAFDLKNSSLALNDQSVTPEVKLKADAVSLHLEQFSSDWSQAMKMSLHSSFSRKAKLEISGSSTSQLKKTDLKLDAQGLPLALLYPYFSKYLNVSLTRGRADVKGQFAISNLLDAQRQIRYKGLVSLKNFHVLENGTSEDFLEWKEIALNGIDASFGNQAPQVAISKLDLNDFYARAILSEKGKLNLQNILSHEATTATPEQAGPESASGTVQNVAIASVTETQPANASVQPLAAAKPAMHISIAQTTLHGGNINFTDNFIKPNYSANLTAVSGNIGAISSDLPQAATVELTGKIDDDAPLVISGSLNPLSSPILLDIKGSATGLELTRLTPYAAKYAGYAIEKGKLSTQVSYHIENQQLQAENDIRLDQLTFGERVDSPTATKLPVMLAVALLRDNDGEIAINLPISGSLNDPKFSVGGIIFRVFVNLITKAVTSPFALLGSMFGGGEELAYAEFSPGLTVLTPATITKLDSLAKALKNRSGLKLDIVGRIDPVSDSAGLREFYLTQKMRDLKWRELRQKDRSIKKDSVTLNDEDKKKYIEQVYQAEKFDKPRNMIGIAKTLPTADAEQLILKNTVVTPEALRALAQQRADVVRDYLEDVSGIQRDRLFLVAPKLNPDGIKDKGSPNRVDFSLK
ncbi:MAG: DUF748 domain-containing protein [Burkholderiales bacterium]|nr:DUF748 domain-containing protein [Burkholderiales bacterium]